MEKESIPESTPEVSVEDCIASVRDKIDKLELIDNSYFQKDRPSKMQTLHDQIMTLLNSKMFDVEKANKKTKSEYYYLKGKTYDFHPEFHKEAEELLSKAVKLRPCWHEPMRALAHVYWKKQDYAKSVMLYQNAIEEEPNDKRALRCLSMVIRKLPFKTEKEKLKHLKQSIDYGK